MDGMSILVTGGTGSFGQAFVHEVLHNYKPKRLVIFSRDEYKHSLMQKRFGLEEYPAVRFFLGDIRDERRLEWAFKDIDLVIHAAALKQVVALEYNPFEAVRTNVLGVENVVQAAIRQGVKKVLALSSDKAVNPLNLYGATKLCGDKLFVAANALSVKGGTRFSVVRYGNVLASRGSVVPLFMECQREKKPVPITDPRMTRFWFTLQKAVRFVMARALDMQGREIFVPKMPSMKVVDLARALAPDCELEVNGIRPGEKLNEVLIPRDESRNTVEMADHYVTWTRAFSGHKPTLNGEKVPEDFVYASDQNKDWLRPEKLLELIASDQVYHLGRDH
jgi:UDP-N-acetylglucosamine 4,6-dehydratase